MFDIDKPDDPVEPGGTPPIPGEPSTPPTGGPPTPPSAPEAPPEAEPTLREVMDKLKSIEETLARIETKCGG